MRVLTCARKVLAGLLVAMPAVNSRPRRLGRIALGIGIALLFGATTVATAQYFEDPYGGGYGPGGYGPASGGARLNTPLPGDYWFAANGADRGLGYEGSYASAGAVVPLIEDKLWGTWVFDGRGHISEWGDFFGNVGVMRRQYIGKLMLGAGVFYDYDGDRGDTYAHDYHQIGVSGEVLAERLEWRINGYIPINPQNDIIGYNNTSFFGNNIVLQQGIDAALAGVDSTMGFQLYGLDTINAVARFGGYHYETEHIDSISGFMAQLDFTPVESIDVLMQINHDDYFETTGSISLAYHFGGSPRKTFSRAIDRPTRRNDHIVRIHQDAIFALNPTNALNPWRVIHVDNTAAAGGDGTFENPINNFTEADALANAEHDIILVRDGDGTSTGYDTGITLDNFQRLYGDGIAHTIPTQFGSFQLENDLDGSIPSITNPIGPAVTLASNNEVAGFSIVGANVGIQGAGITNALIRNNVIAGSSNSGVDITDAAGVIAINNNMIINNGTAGVRYNQTAGDSTLVMNDNTVTGNTIGANIIADNATITASLARNNLSDNVAKGVQIIATNGADITFNLTDSQLDRNGVTGNAGTALTYELDDSTLTSLVEGNTFIENAGALGNPIEEAAGIRGIFNNNSNVTLTVRDNTFNGGHIRGVTQNVAGHFVRLDFDLTNTAVNTVLIEDNQMLQSSSASVWVNGAGLATIDLNIRDNTFSDGRHDAIFLTTTDDALMQATILRNDLLGIIDVDTTSSINRDNAINLFSSGDSRMIVYLQENQILNTATGLVIDADPTLTDGHALHMQALDGSAMVVEATNNQMSDGGHDAVRMDLFDTATIVAIFRQNQMLNNADPDQSFLTLVDAGAGGAGLVLLELTDNVATQGFQLTNDSAFNIFGFENGGGNVGGINTTGTVVPLAPGTTQTAADALQVFP